MKFFGVVMLFFAGSAFAGFEVKQVIVFSQTTTSIYAKTYHIAAIKASWHTALDYCNARGWRLAAIKSKHESDQLHEHIKESGLKFNFWTAGIKNSSEVERKSNFYWMGHDEPMTFTDWHEGEPKGSDSDGQYCVHLQGWNGFNGPKSWAVDRCDMGFYFVCEEGPRFCKAGSESEIAVNQDQECDLRFQNVNQETPFVFSSTLYTSQAMLIPTGFKRYHLITELKVSWYNALHYCSTRGWRLAAITSKQENHAALQLIKRSGLQDHFWLAGTDVGNESNFYWMGHDITVTFADWHPGQPDSLDSNQHCVTTQYWNDNGRYEWAGDNCDTKFYFMCEERTQFALKMLDLNQAISTSDGVKQYRLISDVRLSWKMALHYCAARGWRLAAITSKQENDRIVNLVKESGLEDHFWLAGTDLGNESNFYWLGHDSAVTFTDWHPGQPDNWDWAQDCLTIQYWPSNGLYQWDDDRCFTKFHFICEGR